MMEAALVAAAGKGRPLTNEELNEMLTAWASSPSCRSSTMTPVRGKPRATARPMAEPPASFP